MTRSLRFRVAAISGCAVAVLLAAAFLLVYVRVRRVLYDGLDTLLRRQAEALSAMVEFGPSGETLELDPKYMPDFQSGSTRAYFQIRDRTAVVISSPSLGSLDLPFELRSATATFMDVTLPSGTSGRGIVFRSIARPADNVAVKEERRAPFVWIVVARDKTDMLLELRGLATSLGLAAAIAIACALPVLAIVVWYALRPVRQLAEDIASLGNQSLGERLDGSAVPTELRPVVLRLNELLGRLEQAFCREQALTADMAHELRTPIAGARATMEVCLSRDRSPGEYRAALRRCVHIFGSMNAVLDSLLLLARADAGHIELAVERFEVCTLLRESWSCFADRAEQRMLEVRWDLPQSLVVCADLGKLRSVMNNLLDNAVSYASAQGKVDVRVRGGEQLQLTVTNSAPDFVPEAVTRAFDRFWRADKVRSFESGHYGLGLSVVQKLVNAMGGTVDLAYSDEAFVVSVVVPVAPPSDADCAAEQAGGVRLLAGHTVVIEPGAADEPDQNAAAQRLFRARTRGAAARP